MSDCTTIARPYAKAIFEYALAHKQLVAWSSYLHILAQTVSMPQAEEFIANPETTVEQHIQLLNSVTEKGAKGNEAVSNLISLLSENKRLSILPAIYALYEVLRAEQEKTLVVDVVSFSKVSADQEKELIESLSKRLKRTVSLQVSIDPSVIGGALIQAGDLVIDGTIRGKLLKLKTELAA